MEKTMVKMNAVLLVLASAMAWTVGGAQAATIGANSCSRADVQSAIDRAAAGDVVQIPAGNCSWSSAVNLEKGISVLGAGTNSTIINKAGAVLFNIHGYGSGNCRVAHLGFTSTAVGDTKDIAVEGAFNSLRFDHINWDTDSTQGLFIGHDTYWNDVTAPGVYYPGQKILIDNIDYNTTGNGGQPFALIWGRNHRAWQEADGWGTDNFVVIEDSSFSWNGNFGYLTDTEFGGRIVVRHSTIRNGSIDTHDLGSTPNSRGNRAQEIYDNVFTATNCENNEPCFYAIIFRGGPSLFYNNTLSGYSIPSWPYIYRVAYNNSWVGGGFCGQSGNLKMCQDGAKHCTAGNRRPCYDNSDCSGAGSCGSSWNCDSNDDCSDINGNPGLCMQIDGDGAGGYPCRDQMGRGKDNPTTGVQALSPTYWWNNTVDGVNNVKMAVGGSDLGYPDYMQENRDFCNHSPATACGAKAAWTYTPLAYPHPWRSGEPVETGDNQDPVVTSFTVSPATVAPGGTVTAAFSATDDPNQVAQVELWRTTDSGGAPDDANWILVPNKTRTVSAVTYSGTFTDTPPQGTYWYGLHAVDQAGNVGYEPTPRKVTVGSGGCTPSCANRQCGDDGCGGSCPPGCTASQACVNYQCQAISSNGFLPNQTVEAEQGSLSSPMHSLADSSASGGQAVEATIDNQGSARYSFQVANPGQYRLKARTKALDTGVDSFFVGLDSEAAANNSAYVFWVPNTAAWSWNYVSKWGNGTEAPQYDPMTYTLSAGTHSFTFYGREANTLLDQLVLEPYGTQPPAGTKKSDLDGSGAVDVVDLAIFLGQWGATSRPPADLDQDGSVNAIDLAMFLGEWG